MKTRNKIYETNSSSSHSFSMGPEGRFSGNLININKDGKIYISGSEWEDKIKTNSQIDKLSYLYSLVYTFGDDPEKYFKSIEKVVCDFTGAKKVVLPRNLDDLAPVDHQSRSIIDCRDILNPEFVKEFVFNDSTWLYLLWDWDDREADFYEPTEKSLTKIYRFEFELPGLSKENSTIEISQKALENNGINSELKAFFRDVIYLPEEKRFVKGETDPKGWSYLADFIFIKPNTILSKEESIQIIPKISLI